MKKLQFLFRKKYLLLLFTLFFSVGYSQDGTLNTAFNPPILNNLHNGFEKSSADATIVSTKILSNGKILVYGDFNSYKGTLVNKLALLNPNGTLDTSFNVGSGPNDIYVNNSTSSMLAEQSDGKIIVVGTFTIFNGYTHHNIVRLNPNGSTDNSFYVGYGSDGDVYSVKLQNDGKVLCGGNFSIFSGYPKNSFVRLNSNGSVDNSLNVGSGFQTNLSNGLGTVNTINIQPDNKILIGGNFLKYNNIVKINLVRLNVDGTIDNSFNIGIGAGADVNSGTFNGRVQKILYDTQLNKIYITGFINSFNGTTGKNLMRLNIDGSIDPDFNFASELINLTDICDLAFTSNGKLLLGGRFTYLNNSGMIRVNPDGSVDDFRFFAMGYSQAVQSILSDDEFIMASGNFKSINYSDILKGSIVKLLHNGLTDVGFNPNFGSLGFTSPIVLTDGTILVNPYLTVNFNVTTNFDDNGLYNERLTTGLIHINADGSLNGSDYPNFFEAKVYANRLIQDNLTNVFASVGVTQKISNNGLLVDSFASTAPIIAPNSVNYNVLVFDHAVQNDNKVLIGGNFTYSYLGNTQYRQRIMRVNADGTLDTSFSVGKGINGLDDGGEVYKVNAIQLVSNDNKCVLGGNFTRFHDTTVANIVKLNGNGSIDDSFITGTGFNKEVKQLKYQPAIDKLVVIGNFTIYNTSNANYIIRLNSDGTIDATFNSPFTADTNNLTHLSNILIQPNGKYIVSGFINSRQILKRLNSDGSFDNSFFDNSFSTANLNQYDLVGNLSLMPDNKILITGHFDHINEINRRGIAVLNNNVNLSTSDPIVLPKQRNISIIPNPVKGKFKTNLASDKTDVYAADGRFIKNYSSAGNEFDVSDLKSGIYLLKFYVGDNFYCSKLIMQ